MRRERARRVTTKPLPYYARTRALGATAHWAGRFGRATGATHSWTDLIAGLSVTSTGAARPTERAAGGWTFAGAEYLDVDDTIAEHFDASDPYTLYTVSRIDASAGTSGVISVGACSASHWTVHGSINASRYGFAWRDDGASTVNTGTVATGTDNITTSWIYSRSAYDAWDGGAQTVTAGANTKVPTTATRFTVGALRYSGGGTSRWWVGDILEVVLFAGVQHSEPTRILVEGLLNSAWGI